VGGRARLVVGPVSDLDKDNPTTEGAAMRPVAGAFAAVALVGSVVGANYLTTRYGFVPVGFGEAATAGTFAAGFALAARDALHDALGRWWMLAALAAGAVLSFLVADPSIALASALAFALAEVADFAVYAPLRRRGRFGGRWWTAAVAGSGAVGAVVDTAVFVGIAFGATAIAPALLGQLIGKGYAQAVYLLIGWTTKAARS
jgi:queuosine precursor transporter